jgi:hypothetical protein
MLKGLLALSIVVSIPADAAFAAAKKTSARSFEECHALAVSRGVHPKKRPDRYTTLTGFGEKTQPEGLMARCMAGKKI